MDKNKFKNWSDATRDTIQDTIEAGDFYKLCQDMLNSVDRMLKSYGVSTSEEERQNARMSGMRDGRHSNADRQYRGYHSSGTAYGGSANPYSKTAEQSARYAEAYNRRAASQPRRSSSSGRMSQAVPRQRAVKKVVRRESDRYYLSKKGTEKNSFLATVAGFGAALLSFAAFLAGNSAVFFGITVGAAIAGTLGLRRLRLASRFQHYRNMIGDDTSIKISRIAEETGRSEKDVVKDIEKMLKAGWFVEGHLDADKTYLITSEEMYRIYLEKQLQSMQLKKEEDEKKAQEEQIPAEVRDVIHSGAEYIKEIHACNDRIPGEEISAKISRMETIIRQIFIRTEKHPEVAGELRKTMNYYLPTTIKLLHAYEDLDSQPIEGANIASSKKEIEDTLDTLNAAYEKLLDKLFKDTAWDVSTDISVIKTLLAQEGLTDSDFAASDTKGGLESVAKDFGYSSGGYAYASAPQEDQEGKKQQ